MTTRPSGTPPIRTSFLYLSLSIALSVSLLSVPAFPGIDDAMRVACDASINRS